MLTGDKTMEAKFWKLAVGLGVPGLALAIFYKLYNQLQWSLVGISSDKVFILVIIFMIVIAVVVLFALYVYKPARVGDKIVHKYDRLRDGLSSPEQNVSLIEEIANSSDENKSRYLEEFLDNKNISFLEITASKLALEKIKNASTTSGLFAESTNHERSKLMKMSGATGDHLLDTAIIGLKYWRFLNRRNHPQFSEVEAAIANSLTFRNPEQIVETLKKINIDT